MAHSHGHPAHDRNERRLFWTALLTGAFMLVEAVGCADDEALDGEAHHHTHVHAHQHSH